MSIFQRLSLKENADFWHFGASFKMKFFSVGALVGVVRSDDRSGLFWSAAPLRAPAKFSELRSRRAPANRSAAPERTTPERRSVMLWTFQSLFLPYLKFFTEF